ncbi:MAG: disulfide bond formation protein B, partial [Nevskiales bacterium]
VQGMTGLMSINGEAGGDPLRLGIPVVDLATGFNATIGILCALSGLGVGVWHVWLQLHPPAVSACGPSLEYLVSNLPLGRALPRIFQGYGDCTAIDWTFLGLSIPGWSIVWLGCLAAALTLAQRRRA